MPPGSRGLPSVHSAKVRAARRRRSGHAIACASTWSARSSWLQPSSAARSNAARRCSTVLLAARARARAWILPAARETVARWPTKVSATATRAFRRACHSSCAVVMATNSRCSWWPFSQSSGPTDSASAALPCRSAWTYCRAVGSEDSAAATTARLFRS